MSNTITFPNSETLSAHVVHLFRIYAGPWPEWADTERKRAFVYAKRAAFGLTGVTRLELEDTTGNVALLDSMGEKLHAAAVSDAEARAEYSVGTAGYSTVEETITALQESGQWPADFPDEHWHFAAIRELIFTALTK